MSYSVYAQAALEALSGLTPSANQIPYFDGGSSATSFASSSFGRGLVGDADAAAARTTIGVVIGTDVQAHGDVLDDLNTLGAPASDGQFLVATGAGAFAYESGNTARTSLELGTGDVVQFLGAAVNGLSVVSADGGITNVGSAIQHNVGYTATSQIAVDLVGANVQATATADTVNGNYVLGVAATSNPTVTTTGSATFSANDIIQVSGSANDGIYEVLSHIGNTLTIKGVGTTAATDPFFKGQWATTANDGAAITKVNVIITRVSSAGALEISTKSATTPLSYGAPPDQLQTWTAATGTINVSDSPSPLYYKADTTGGTVTINLPDQPSTDGMEVTVKLAVRPGSNNVTIARSGATDTIDGATSKTLDTLYQSISLKYDAADNVWYII
jgi:hypothetical protein